MMNVTETSALTAVRSTHKSPKRRISEYETDGQGGPRMTSDKGGSESWWSTFWSSFLAEFMATALLVGLGSNSSHSIWAFGLLVLANMIVFGNISGAHMNPAVSLAAGITRHMKWPLVLGYIISQLLGAVFGMAMLALSYLPDYSRASCLGCTFPMVPAFPALILELGATAMLVLVCCATWDSNHTETAPFKIALTYVGLMAATVAKTCGSLNPARSFGPALVNLNWTWHWVYWLGPLGGSVLGALLYRFVVDDILRQ